MNWILVGVIIVLGLYAFLGMKKGMIRIILSLVALIATLLITMTLTPIVSDYIQTNTNIYSNLQKAIYKGVQKNDLVGKAFEKVGEEELEVDMNQPSSSYIQVTDNVVRELALPDSLKKQIMSNINIDQYVDQGMTSVKEMIVSALVERITKIIFNILIFAIIFMLLFIIMQIIIKVADIVTMLPVLKQINKIGGLGLGLVKGLIVVWIFFIVMTIFCHTKFAQDVFVQINNNSFLGFLYNNNLIMKLIFSII